MTYCEGLKILSCVRLLLVNIFASDCELYAKMRHGCDIICWISSL